MTMRDQIRALEAENAGLKAELAVLRAHVCLPPQPVCTCTFTSTAGLIGCPVHQWQPHGGGIWVGDVPPGHTVIVNTVAPKPVTGYVQAIAASACAGRESAYWVDFTS